MTKTDGLELQRINSLISHCRTLNHYEALLMATTGEHFNLLNIVGIAHLEVKTHSPIISELLDPKGSHGQRDAFLNIFASRLNLIEDVESCADCEVIQEYTIGQKTETTGGRIDILIRKGSKPWIIIENKIGAELGDNQLLRYQNYAPEANLIYLTLNGENPTNDDGNNYTNLKCLSYTDDIIGWLEECRKEATTTPTLRESITQYINLLKQLTNQNLSNHMNKQIIDSILTPNDPENLRAYFTLRGAENDIRNTIIKKLRSDLELICENTGLALREMDGLMNTAQSGFYLENQELEKENLLIGFAFDNSGYRDCYFGFAFIDPKKTEQSPMIPEMKKLFEERYGETTPTEYWPISTYWSKHRNWTEKTLKEIYYGNFKEDLEEVIKDLVALALK